MKGITYFFGIIVIVAIIVALKKAYKSQYNKIFAKEINEFIEKMKCPYCQEYEKPLYEIDKNNNETLSCCCEKFASILQERIRNRNSHSTSSQQRTNLTNKNQLSQSPKEIADNITTIQQFRSLEKKLERAEEKIINNDYKSDKAYDNASRKHDLLQEAVDLASSQTYQWQFIPDVDLDTPLNILNLAYKVYSREEYDKLDKSLLASEGEWYEIDAYEEKEDPEPYITALKKFRIIIESDKTQNEKIKSINQLTSKNKNFRETFFETDSELTLGDQIFAEELRNAGLPMAYILYSEGYITPVKCLEIDPTEFIKRKGVGPKKVEQLKQFQAKVKPEATSA